MHRLYDTLAGVFVSSAHSSIFAGVTSYLPAKPTWCLFRCSGVAVSLPYERASILIRVAYLYFLTLFVVIKIDKTVTWQQLKSQQNLNYRNPCSKSDSN